MECDQPDWSRSPFPDWGVKEDPYLDDEGNDTSTTYEQPTGEPVPTTAPTVAAPAHHKTSTPPSKPPPVSHSHYRNLSNRRPPGQPSSSPRSKHPRPPSPSSTSSEDPVILRANVPVLKKARPGQPPLRLQPPPTEQALPSSTFPTAPPPPPTEQHSWLEVTVPRPQRNGQPLPFKLRGISLAGPSEHTIPATLSTYTSSHSNSNAHAAATSSSCTATSL